jgi:hypothetical protein
MRKWVLLVLAIIVTAGLGVYLAQGYVGQSSGVSDDAFPPPPMKRRETRDREAQKVVKIFEAMEKHNKSEQNTGARYKISESELNSYLSYLVEKESVRGVDALFVKLRDGSFSTYAVVDVDSVPKKDKDTVTRVLMQTILAGKQYLSADGLLTARDGMGQYTLTAARINEIDIPPSIINSLINTVGRKQNPPFDLTKPFKLPYGIREALVKRGYLELS